MKTCISPASSANPFLDTLRSGGEAPPAAAYFYSPDRGAKHPAAHMAAFTGFLQAGGYAGFEALYDPARTKPGPITEVACLAGRGSTYRQRNAVQTNPATSVNLFTSHSFFSRDDPCTTFIHALNLRRPNNDHRNLTDHFASTRRSEPKRRR